MNRGLCSTILALVVLLASPAIPVPAQELEGTLTLSGAWAVYPTAVAWGDAFEKLHPKVRVEVSAGGAGKGAADAIAGLVDIGMVSREPDPAEVAKGITPFYVLHDAVFPVVSDKNPVLDELLKKGLQVETLKAIYKTGTVATWGAALGSDSKLPIHVFTRSDSCGAAAAWGAPFGAKQEDLKGVGIYGDPGLLEAVVKDPVGIGYSNFSYVFTRDGSVLAGIRLAPIDADNSGTVEPNETFTQRETAIAAIEAGTYPVTRRSFFFVKGPPAGLVKEFLRFILSDEGTQVVDAVGTSLPLPTAEREKVIASLK